MAGYKSERPQETSQGTFVGEGEMSVQLDQAQLGARLLPAAAGSTPLLAADALSLLFQTHKSHLIL